MAHAMAPGAKIDVIEVNDDANWAANILAGDALAARCLAFPWFPIAGA